MDIIIGASVCARPPWGGKGIVTFVRMVGVEFACAIVVVVVAVLVVTPECCPCGKNNFSLTGSCRFNTCLLYTSDAADE